MRTRCAAAGVMLTGICVALAGSTGQAAEAKFHWENNEAAGTADLKFGEQPVVRYMFAYDDSTPERRELTYKTYHHVFAPGTQTIITKGPGGLYPHHRGLYVAWNKTGYEGKQSDFWHGTNGNHQRHAKFLDMKGDEKQGTMTAEIHWNDKEGKPVIIETRTLAVTKLPVNAAPGYGWQIDFHSSLASQRGTITLDGDRQHAGFQFRADQPVADAKGARYVRPSGFPEQPEAFEVDDKKEPEGHINLNWLGMTYDLDGKRYNVEYCEDPSLPKPSRYSERPYGRFGAFFKTELQPGKPLLLRYRAIVTAGETPTRNVMQKRYDAFASSLKRSSP